MKYSDGTVIAVGDVVRLWDGCEGVVVCSLDDSQFSDAYPKAEWEYLRVGVLIMSDEAGLVHYPVPNEDLVLIRRKA